MRPALLLLCVLSTYAIAGPQNLPQPGDPRALTDWRWLARAPVGERRVSSDCRGERDLPKADGGYVVLRADGPGVVDHFWTRSGAKATMAIIVDGQRLWRGRVAEGIFEAYAKKSSLGPFPAPLVCAGGGMAHLLAPVGFRRRIELIADRKSFPHYASYRTFPDGTRVMQASSETDSQYVRGLKRAAEVWLAQGFGFGAPGGNGLTQEFVLEPQSRATTLSLTGSGEVTSLRFRILPALTGSPREVVAELYYGPSSEPSLRLPITDLVGAVHPWAASRWDRYVGDLAAGIRHPWIRRKPRLHYPHVEFCLNLPVPFADGLRIDLINRSKRRRFTGSTRAVVKPLSPGGGWLCGTRRIVRVADRVGPQPLMRLPGSGRLVGLSLFMSGNSMAFPRAARQTTVSLRIDGASTVAGAGFMPLWFQRAYGGAITSHYIWSHPRMEHNFVGLTRHFITDPIQFRSSTEIAYDPGSDGPGLPSKATIAALWYRFGNDAYEAPALPEQAEPLPHSEYGAGAVRVGTGKSRQEARLFQLIEAEDLAPMAVARGCQVEAVEDVEHNYHPSAGKYLRVTAENPGGYVDCAMRLPHTRYVAVGTYSLWFPQHGAFETHLLSTEEAKSPTLLPHTRGRYQGRELWNPAMKSDILMGGELWYRRDPSPSLPVPVRNPSPDGKAILRFLCVSHAKTPAHLLMLDQVRLDMPPLAKPGWHEFEDGPMPEGTRGLSAHLPRYGRFEWSGWGSLVLSAPEAGQATFKTTLATGPAQPRRLTIRGSLGPKQGSWRVGVGRDSQPVVLAPAKNDRAVREWVIPVNKLTLPGPITLTVTCTQPAAKAKGQLVSPRATLCLDAWTLE